MVPIVAPATPVKGWWGRAVWPAAGCLAGAQAHASRDREGAVGVPVSGRVLGTAAQRRPKDRRQAGRPGPKAALILPLALLFLGASSASVVLVDEMYQIPANEWRYVEVSLQQQPALIWADYRAEAGAKDVRVALLRREDLQRLRNQRAHGWLAETEPAPTGRLRFRVRDPGEYAIVVDNRGGDRQASVYLKVGLDFGSGQGPDVTTLSPRRQLAVILISFAVFFGVVTWSARRLLRNAGR